MPSNTQVLLCNLVKKQTSNSKQYQDIIADMCNNMLLNERGLKFK